VSKREPADPQECEKTDVEETVPEEVQFAEMQDRFLRVSAEFENYKKRRQRETQDLLRFAHESLIRDLLPVMDSFERAILSSEGTRDYDAFHDGILLILQQLHEVLNNAGVERVSPEGELFDPNWHEAVGVCPHDEIEPDHVASVIEPGYRLHDRVIRPARVMVVSHPAEDEESVWKPQKPTKCSRTTRSGPSTTASVTRLPVWDRGRAVSDSSPSISPRRCGPLCAISVDSADSTTSSVEG